MSIGSGCQAHLRAKELPAGRLIVRLSKRVAAVIEASSTTRTTLRAAGHAAYMVTIRSRQRHKHYQFETCTTVHTSPAAWVIHSRYSR
jgi:hypothetical protein